jgi:dTDP-4-amino-4,6-dideoxygalactose transaminase
MKIPFVDLPKEYQLLKEEYDRAYHRVMSSNSFILGPELQEFEKNFAQYCGVKFVIGVGNGLEALHLILRALDIGDGHCSCKYLHSNLAGYYLCRRKTYSH